MSGVRDRAFGWRKDGSLPVHGTVKLSALRVGDSGDAPIFDSPDLSGFRGPRTYQGQLSSCVAFATKRCIRICDAIAKRSTPNAVIPDAAARFIYWAGRRAPYAGTNPTTLPALIDDGCMPSLAIQAVANIGFPLEAACPYDLTDVDANGNVRWVNAQPPDGAFRRAYDQRGLVFVKVYGDRVNTVAAGHRAGWSAMFGMNVDKAFLALKAGGVISSVDVNSIVGGHMMTVLDPEPTDEPGTMKVDNWWPDWGESDGTGRITQDVFNSTNVSDVILVKSVPIYSEAP